MGALTGWPCHFGVIGARAGRASCAFSPRLGAVDLVKEAEEDDLKVVEVAVEKPVEKRWSGRELAFSRSPIEEQRKQERPEEPSAMC